MADAGTYPTSKNCTPSLLSQNMDLPPSWSLHSRNGTHTQISTCVLFATTCFIFVVGKMGNCSHLKDYFLIWEKFPWRYSILFNVTKFAMPILHTKHWIRLCGKNTKVIHNLFEEWNKYRTNNEDGYKKCYYKR